MLIVIPPERCDGCGRLACDLPAFGPGPFDGQKLARNYRGGDVISATWECPTCFPLTDHRFAARRSFRTYQTIALYISWDSSVISSS